MSPITAADIKPLRRFNLIAGGLHLLSLIGVLSLANSFALPIYATYMKGAPGTALADPVVLIKTPVAYVVALFLAISALFHFLVASPKFFPRYSASLMQSKNIFRWVEYSISSSIMIVLIAQLCGVSDVAAIIAIFAVNASMILFGWLQEKYTTPGDGQWLPFIFGCIAGAIPWLIIILLVIEPKASPRVSPPGFVYGIIISLFLFFNCFAYVQFKQYKAKGKWANYLRGERAYIILSLVAKSALAWQIFGGTLAGN
ncbi:MAG: heliorhodopsin HeR [Actinomycetes bacterium]